MSRITARERAAVLAIATRPAGASAPTRRGKASFLEFAEQSLFAQRLRLDGRTRDLPWTATMQGINLPPLQAKLAKAKGVQKGVPDFLLFVAGWGPQADGVGHVGLALEFKSPTEQGRQSIDQAEWERKLVGQGWRYELVLTSAQAWSCLCEYLELPE